MVETGPKLVSRYISRPALYHGGKFDLRYIVLVPSLVPLDVYVYKMFWIRVANQPYSLDHFDEYEKHFTVSSSGCELKPTEPDFFVFLSCSSVSFLFSFIKVMNYSAFKLQQILYTDFIREFEKENLSGTTKTWADIQAEINKMFKVCFLSLCDHFFLPVFCSCYSLYYLLSFMLSVQELLCFLLTDP